MPVKREKKIYVSKDLKKYFWDGRNPAESEVIISSYAKETRKRGRMATQDIKSNNKTKIDYSILL